MNARRIPRFLTPLFVVAALYDGVLGIVFLFAGGAVFEYFEVAPPNHLGYVQFPAALLIIFALMYAAIAADPVKNRNLIPYGILLKIAYCSIVLAHWVGSENLPGMWKPFCIFDLVFLALFAWAWSVVKERESNRERSNESR